ncbi:MAG: CocE/NonD family hydrolase [Rhodospirillales bacterium]
MDSAVESSASLREVEHLLIPLPDGVRLAARLWLPVGAAPLPAIFEYIPYRKTDMVRARDERNHPVFAARGYACLRVDMRGSGDSEGLMADMYSREELEDAHHVIAWIAAQPWCDGRVGMFGTSWGGTASLQAAVDAPAALKAIIAVCATDDRYDDDIHHKGGLLLTDSIEWGATLPAILASPPVAANVGESWRSLWDKRLEALAFPLEAWVREEERSAYWQWGSVSRQARRLSCPVLAVSGWSDGYANTVVSLVERCPDQVWGIVGPWGHHYPDVGHPGPAMGFQQEALDWWDFWLKGQGRRPDWPRLRLWLRHFDRPRPVIDERQGDWIELAEPASAVTESQALYLDSGALSERPAALAAKAEVPYDLRVGAASGDTGYFGRFGGQPRDQAVDDARSLVYESAPLREEMVVLGGACCELLLTADQPLAQIVLRIVDVAPDGSLSRVALALRNLALDDHLEGGRPLVPGALRALRVRFPAKAYRFAPGHRLRLALSASYWPLAWPSPRPVRLTLDLAQCRLLLPLLRGTPTALARPFAPAVQTDASFERVSDGRLSHRESEAADGTLIASWHQAFTSLRYPAIDSLFGFETRARHSLHPKDPLSANSRFDHFMRFERPDGTAEVEAWAGVGASADHYRLEGGVTVSWRGRQIFERQWSPQLRRRLS